ncbi:PhzF family phenazine biosynthesis protein [Streptomyces mirabilis]
MLDDAHLKQIVAAFGIGRDRVSAIGAYPHGSRHDFEMRTFAPRCGVAEDPACGSMNAAVGQWLTTTGAV